MLNNECHPNFEFQSKRKGWEYLRFERWNLSVPQNVPFEKPIKGLTNTLYGIKIGPFKFFVGKTK